MTTEQMDKEIKDYCISLILNSINEDWVEDYLYKGRGDEAICILVKDKLVIVLDKKTYYYGSYSIPFKAKIYLDNTFGSLQKTYYFRLGFCWNKKERKIRKQLKTKHKEILSYITNKKEYNEMITTYNLLPIKELRKKKLLQIETNEM